MQRTTYNVARMSTSDDQHVEQSRTDALTASLREPTAYQHQTKSIDVLQTHISLLLFAGDFVYKVKRPVDMGFLDYTTLEKRKHFCEEEVRLNRRLAADIYLGVVPIRRDQPGHISVDSDGDGAGEIIEYAVRMKRLPANRMLSALLDHGEIDNQQINDIVDVLHPFHHDAPTGAGVDEFGEPDELRRQVDDTLSRLAANWRRIGVGAEEHDRIASIIEHVHRHLIRFIENHKDVFLRRIASGRIREGHGDLHAGNICLLEKEIVIYDCIEFDRRLRCRDVAAELSFLAMDLDHRGYHGFSRYLLYRYAQSTRDKELERLAPFYKCNFAAVRALVAVLRASEVEDDSNDRAESLREAEQYLSLAASYTIGPALILMFGLPGSGKSHAARAIAVAMNAIVLRSDVIRKQLANLPAVRRASDEQYTEDFSDRVFEVMLDEAKKYIKAGRIVVVDATFIRADRRKPFIDLANRLGVPLLIVELHADEKTIRKRMIDRAADRTSVSDADWNVYLTMRDNVEPPDELPAAQRLVVQSPIENASLLPELIEKIMVLQERADRA